MANERSTPHEQLIDAARYYVQKVKREREVRETYEAALVELLRETGFEAEATDLGLKYIGSLKYAQDMVRLAQKNLELNLPHVPAEGVPQT